MGSLRRRDDKSRSKVHNVRKDSSAQSFLTIRALTLTLAQYDHIWLSYSHETSWSRRIESTSE